jgi:glycine cleavage system transcriptional repressor
MGEQYLVISALGPDRPGLVKDLTDFLAARGANIDDSRMAILGAEFGTMLLISGSEEAIGKVEHDLPAMEAKTGAKTLSRRTKSPEDYRRGALRSFVVTAESFDREGIVRAIASSLHDLGANIVSLETTQWNAPFTGATLFRIELAAEVPQVTSMAKVRAKMEEVSVKENLDIEVRTESH